MAAAVTTTALLTTGCIFFPPFPVGPPFGAGEVVIGVENASDEELVVRFAGTDAFTSAFAVPPSTSGEAYLFATERPDRVELLSADCELIDEVTFTDEAAAVRIASDGVGLGLLDAPLEPGRMLIEYLECDGQFSAPPLDGDEVELLGSGLLVVGAGYDGDLWSVSLPGREMQQLTSGPDMDAEGSVSPDGTRVAFTRYDPAAGASAMYVMDLVGGEPEPLRDDAASAAWSPDGLRIAMVDLDPFAGGLGSGIVVVDPTSGEEVAVQASSAGPPAWSPDGSRIAFTDHDQIDDDSFGDPFSEMPPARIMVADLDAGGEPQEIAQLPAAGSLAWSPDGAALLLEAWDGGLTILDVATGDEEMAIDAGGSYTQWARWSPDGESLAFIRVGTFGDSALMTVAASGGEPTEIATFGSELYVTGLIWSPDGERLAVATQGFGLTGDLYFVDADGGEPITVLNGVQYLLGWVR